jgi:hypothetical protein
LGSWFQVWPAPRLVHFLLEKGRGPAPAVTMLVWSKSEAVSLGMRQGSEARGEVQKWAAAGKWASVGGSVVEAQQ